MKDSIYEHTFIRRTEHEDRPDTYHLIVRDKAGNSIAIRELSKERIARLRPILESLCDSDPERGAEYLYRHDQDTVPPRRV
jgi:hypothetical protein